MLSANAEPSRDPHAICVECQWRDTAVGCLCVVDGRPNTGEGPR